MSAADNVVVVAQWQTTRETLGSVLTLVAEMRRQSLAEPGCLGYEVFQGVGEPGALLLLERYRDSAALEAHRASHHYRELVVERIVPVLAGRRVEFLQAKDPAG
jgi:quinol monooxygenase YgiN